MSSGTHPTRLSSIGKTRLPGPKKGIQRRKLSDAKPPTPVFVPRNAIAESRAGRSNTRPRATCANPACPKPEIVDDDGTKVCATCGTVAQESNIVSEITFGESSTGAAIVQGTFVGADQRHGRGGLGPRGYHSSDDSPNRAQTLSLAKVCIGGIANKLGLPSNINEQAAHIFQISQYQMVQGRSIRAVAAVCLYVACRRRQAVEAHHVMLIDIAEHMNFNVFMLGSIYTKMVRKVHGLGDIEAVNPENLILRFARSLEFGRDTNKIVTEATRIVQRMKRDWMVTGRRPAGICGAALIIAARMNNFRRTVREMVYVVKVTEITINKRLEEFKITDSSKFTVEEFRQVDLNSLKEHDPPAFYLAQEGAKPKRGRKRKAPETAAGIENGNEEDGDNSDETPPPSQKKRVDKDGFAIPDLPIDPALRTAGPPQDGPIDEALTSAVNDAITEMERDKPLYPGPSQKSADRDDDAASVVSTATDASGTTTYSETTGLPRKRGRPKGAKNKAPLPPSGAELALEAAIEKEVRSGIDKISQDPEASRVTTRSAKPTQQPTPPSTQPSTQPEKQPETTTVQPAEKAPASIGEPSSSSRGDLLSEEIGEDEFDDDPEVANCLLSPAEREIKERIWVHENNTWLREQHRKKIQAQLKQADPNQQAEAVKEGKSRKKRRPRLGDPKYLKKDKEESTKDGAEDGTGEEQTAEDEAADDISKSEQAAGRAVKSMLENRAYSTRINYNVMQTLFPGMMARESSVESRRSIDDRARKRERLLAAAEDESRSQTSDSRAASPGTASVASSIGESATAPPPPPPPRRSIQASPSPAALSDSHLSNPITKESPPTPQPAALPNPTESQDTNANVLGTVPDVEEEDESDVDVNIMGDLDDDDEDEEEDEEEVENAFAGRYQQRYSDDEDDDEE